MRDEAAYFRTIAQILTGIEPTPTVARQDFYRAIHAWALRGLGYGLGDHPTTSGERGVLEVLAMRCRVHGSVDVPPVVFDVGANVGEYAAMVFKHFYGGVRIYAFEPSQAALLHLVESTAPSWFYPFGLSDAERTMPLHTDALGSGMASVHPRRLDHFGRSLNAEERATFRRLDDVCRDLGVTRIDLLKIDVEGHEFAVLKGAGEMLTSGAIRMIQWEMGGCNLDSRTTLQDFWYLLHERYDIFRVVADGLIQVPHYREADEVFICSNFVAIWRGA